MNSVMRGEGCDGPCGQSGMLRHQNDDMGGAMASETAQTLSRNARIYVARASGATLEDIAREHGISRERVRQIVSRRNGVSRTLEDLPGTEPLSAQTRGLLIRLGYSNAEEVLVAIENGTLRPLCARGMGHGRFYELKQWAATQGRALPLG